MEKAGVELVGAPARARDRRARRGAPRRGRTSSRRGGGSARALDESRPDLVVLVDSPDFYIPFARRARRAGAPVLYYVSPQVWAWRRYRIRKLARRVDRMAVIFPFEPAGLRGHRARPSSSSATRSSTACPRPRRARPTAPRARRRSALDPAAPLVRAAARAAGATSSRDSLPLQLETARAARVATRRCASCSRSRRASRGRASTRCSPARPPRAGLPLAVVERAHLRRRARGGRRRSRSRARRRSRSRCSARRWSSRPARTRSRPRSRAACSGCPRSRW